MNQCPNCGYCPCCGRSNKLNIPGFPWLNITITNPLPQGMGVYGNSGTGSATINSTLCNHTTATAGTNNSKE